MAAATKAGLKDNPAMSFVMLTDSQVVPPKPIVNARGTKPKPKIKAAVPQDLSGDLEQSLSYQIESTTRLFEILSSRSDTDHPICSECTDLLLSSLQSRLLATNKERDAYINFLKTLTNSMPTASELSKAQSVLTSNRTADAQSFSELCRLEKERDAVDSTIADLESKSYALDEEEHDFWRSRNAFALTLSSFQDGRDALNAAYDHDAQQLERLQRTNVYNDTFCIGHDGFFGTINGLRLGRLPPPQNVDWTEINAAWGTASLLLATVAEKLGFIFQGYRIKPMGSTSKIEKLEYPQSSTAQSTTATRNSANTPSQPQQQPKITPLDLFSSGDLPLGRMLLHRRLDAGMVAFLECLRQLGEFVEKGDDSGGLNRTSSTATTTTGRERRSQRDGGGNAGGANLGPALPYVIHKDKIGDSSIRLGVSQDEAWTKACKYALTCCKFLLAHASNVDGPGKGRSSA